MGAGLGSMAARGSAGETVPTRGQEKSQDDETSESSDGGDDSSGDSGSGSSQESHGGSAVGGAGAGKEKGAQALGTAAGAVGVVSSPTPFAGVQPDSPQADFLKWVVAALEATALLQAAGHGTGEVSPGPAAAGTTGDLFAGYRFTGALRPAQVTPQMRPPEGCAALPDYALHPKGVPRSEFLRSNTRTIPVLKGSDLETMREACRLGREVLDLASRFMRVGVTGDDIDRIVFRACQDRALYPSPLNYSRFPKSLCVSANEVICHGIPDCRPLEDGDIVNLDISVYHRGFHSDLNETFFVGACGDESHRLVRATYESLRAACALIRPGTMYRDLGGKIQAVAEQSGCAVVPAYCGHGVGKLFHGPPDIPHYRRNKAIGVMKPGHVFTVEPMLNLGACGKDDTWPDDWTAVTKSGMRSAGFEHTFLVTESGVEVLTARPGAERHAMPAYDATAFQR